MGKKTSFSIIVVLIFAFIAGLPLLHRGLPPTHDGEYHIVRFYEFDKVLRDGNWYPRWASDLNNGYGVPLFNYVYPLPNYIASFFHIFGISFIDSFKLEMFFAFIIGGIFFYLWSKEFWGNLGGIVSSVFYTFSPYHFVDIYIRGSVGEVLALAFFPAFLWSVTNFIKNKKKIFFALSSAFLALIIFSHNILALIFFPFGVSYALLYIIITKNKKLFAICYLLFAILLGIGLSSIFWIPAIFETKYVTGLQIFDVSVHFPEFYQLIVPSWGSGFSGGNIQNQMSFQIGVANLLVILASFVTVAFMTYKKDKNVKLLIFFLFCFLINLFFMLKLSLPFWRSIPFMSYFQFPWRFLSLEIVMASFLAGSLVYFWKSKILAILLLLLVFFLGIGYTKPAYYLYRNDSYYITKSNFIDGTNSPGNAFNTVFFNGDLKKQKDKAIFFKGEGIITPKKITSSFYDFNIEAKKESEIGINTAYFPGWSVFVDNKKVKTNVTSNGLFSFLVDSGKHNIKINFEETIVRKIATVISLIFALSALILFSKRLFATIKR